MSSRDGWTTNCPRSARIRPPTAEIFLLLLRLQHQSLDAAALDEVLLQDLVDIGGAAIAVPDAFGIDHHGGAELAAIETARGVDAHIGKPELLGAHLHVIAQLLAALLAAAAARMAGRPGIGAAEDVLAVEEPGIGGHRR